MNFLLDENFPKAAISVLENAGHRVFDFRQIGVAGAPDELLVETALEKSAVILTTDRDFFHTLGRLHPEHHGILVIALRQPTRSAILGRLEWFLENMDLSKISGKTFQLRDTTWMVYPPF